MTPSSSGNTIGASVIYTEEEKIYDPRGEGPKLLEWPGLLYKWIKFDTKENIYIAGIVIFTDFGTQYIKNAVYSSERKANTWR